MDNIRYCFHVFLCLCERAFRSRLTRREAGQVELWELPNELSAGVILPTQEKQCQRLFKQSHHDVCELERDSQFPSLLVELRDERDTPFADKFSEE
jgi:hypothetical protein